MTKIPKFLFILFASFSIYSSVTAQIVMNGRNPRRNLSPGPKTSLSIAYGYSMWVDGNNVPLSGYSSSLSDFHNEFFDLSSIEKWNVSGGINVGFQKYMNEKFSIKAAFATAKLITGINSRFDLMSNDKSKFTQLGVYGSYSLTKNMAHRFQFQWLFGPELIYAKKSVYIDEYMVDESSMPEAYHQNVTVLEGAIVTGLGLSFRISNAFSIFSDGMIGISLPGKGLKSTNSGLGLKYTW